MIVPSELNAKFLDAYHNPNFVESMSAILDILQSAGNKANLSQHAFWLKGTCSRALSEHASDPSHELPAMLYGMIWTAWTLFLADYAGIYKAHLEDMKIRGAKLVISEGQLATWITDRAWDVFVDRGSSVNFLTNRDVFLEIAHAVMVAINDEGKVFHLRDFTPELIVKILNAVTKDLQFNRQNIIRNTDGVIYDVLYENVHLTIEEVEAK